MSEENKDNLGTKKGNMISDLLMKPFSLGWTREVVNRVNTKNRAPNCDIYYFSPSKKRVRSLTELKSILSDGLGPECFSFKRTPLGLTPDLETIRDAKVRGRKNEKSAENDFKKPNRTENLKQNNNEDDTKNKAEAKTSNLKTESKPDDETNEEKIDSKNSNNAEKETSMKTRKKTADEKENSNISNKKRSKTKPSTLKSSVKKRKSVLKKVIRAKQVKQANVVASKKILKKIVRKMAASPKQKLSQRRNKKDAPLKSTKNKKLTSKTTKKVMSNSLIKAKNDVKESQTNETDKKFTGKDLKSIVQKNIGKYREMREKQKLGAVKSQLRSSNKRTAIARTNISRARSEPISKNKPFYLKPLEKGWRRELVYRTNSARAGQRADVYYFHPSGKKLRSCREIAENLTHGLSIECFTFRKEPIGCGEPSEVVRNARFIQKNSLF